MAVIPRQPTGQNAHHRPDDDGVWRLPVPEYMPCEGCGQLTTTVLPTICPQCRDWNERLQRHLARRAAMGVSQ